MQKNVEGPKIISLQQIQNILPQIDAFQKIKVGFIAYSKKEAVIPPVGELIMEDPPGEAHIKYGYIKSGKYYVVKIASGFYHNAALGLPNSQGVNLLFDLNTGVLKAVLLDQGYLTDVRTAVAGALVSKTLARPSTKSIGIIGSGIQAKLQLEYHLKVMSFDHIFCWNHNQENATNYQKYFKNKGINVTITPTVQSLCEQAELIVTCTPSKTPLIKKEWILSGQHITAVGSDTDQKIEIASEVLGEADLVVVDSISQSHGRGEVFRARSSGFLREDKVKELGSVLENPTLGRQNENEITIADLTGVAVQDLMISEAVFEACKNNI